MTVLVVLALLLALFWLSNSLRARVINPPAEFQTALLNTQNSQFFCFSVQIKIGDRLISNIEGKKAAPDGIYITGTMQNTPIEFMHLDGKAYIKGYWSADWSVLPDSSMMDSELFITELNPLGSFVFRDIPVIKFVKQERIKGTSLQVLELRPIVENQLMELNYENFIYRVWLDPRDKLIRQAHITAAGKNSSRDKLDIVIKMWDYNKPITITPPKIY